MKTIDKPRVALMSYSMDNRPGMGTALYTRRLIEQLLLDDRFEWYLVHYDRVDDPLYTKAHEIVMPVVNFPVGTHFIRQLLFFWRYRKMRFDIIHWFQPRLYPFFWFAPGRHFIATLHGAGDITAPGAFPPSRRMFNFVLRHFHDKLDAIIAVSHFGKREIEECYGAAPERVFTTYPGGGERFSSISPDIARAKVVAAYNLTEPYILDVARLESHKNVGTLVRAYLLARERGVTHKLVLVGRDAGLYRELKQIVDSSPYAADVLFTMQTDDAMLHALYACADLFVFPSYNESFGLPVVEAMSQRVPVITSNVTALPEIVGDGGLVVDPNSVEDLAREIVRVLSDPTLKTKLAARGGERAKIFEWRNTAQKTIELYYKILHKADSFV